MAVISGLLPLLCGEEDYRSDALHLQRSVRATLQARRRNVGNVALALTAHYLRRMDIPSQTSAPAALAAWIAAKTGRRQRLASRLSVSTSTVWRWASGRAVPMRVVRPRIERITRVPAGAWEVQP